MRKTAIATIITLLVATPVLADPFVPVDASKTTVAFLNKGSVKAVNGGYTAEILSVSRDTPGGEAVATFNDMTVRCKPLGTAQTSTTPVDAAGKRGATETFAGVMTEPPARSIAEAIAVTVCTGTSPNESVAGYTFKTVPETIQVGKSFLGGQN